MLKNLFLLLLFSIMPIEAWAVTNFTVTIQPSGGDYTTLNAAAAANQCDLTSAATKVFSHGAITGTISDGASVTGVTSGATGTATHDTSTQILIKSITGTFQSGEVVYQTLGTNFITLSNAGDSAIVVLNPTGTWASADTTMATIQSYTTNTTNYVYIDVTGSARNATGVFSNASPYYRLVLSVNGSSAGQCPLNVSESNINISGLQVHNTYTGTGAQSCAIRSNNDMTGGSVWDSDILVSDSTGTDNKSGAFYASSNNNAFGPTFTNSTFVGPNGAAIYGGKNLYSIFYNDIFIGRSNIGFWESLSGASYGAKLENCYVYGSSSAISIAGSAVTLTNNATSDTTGTSGLQNIAYSTSSGAFFTNVTSGSENFTLNTGSGLIATGINLSGTFTNDITGATRQASGAWDIGAYYYAGTAKNNTFFGDVVLNGNGTYIE